MPKDNNWSTQDSLRASMDKLADAVIALRSLAKTNLVHVAHLLPVNEEGNEHIILFRDGTIYVLRPRDSQAAQKQYTRCIVNREGPLLFCPIEDTIVKNEFIFSTLFGSEAVYRSDNPKQTEAVQDAIKKAFECAAKQREQKLKARAENADFLVKTGNELFGTNQENHPPG